jgi:hypothetical protein
MKHNIKETAASGSVGAHSIAVSAGRLGNKTPTKRSLKGFITTYYDGMGKKFELKPVSFFKLKENNVSVTVIASINETFNLDSVLAQLSSYENKTNVEESEVTTYGVEDNKGNLMKVTVLDTEAEDFESYISAYLSELKDFENEGVDLKDISLAELLYKLKDLFDIRDVEFPNIPDDTVYNADEASDSVENSEISPEGDDMMGDEMGDEMGGEMGDEMPDGEMGADEFGDPMAGDEMPDGEMGDDEFGDDEMMDDESVEDFEDMGDDNSTQSILMGVIDMLKGQAEAETARANAEAERARADQAEYTAKAAEQTLASKEELVAMDAEKDKHKETEKEAKRQAELATFRYKKSRGMVDTPDASFEGFSSDSLLLGALLNEAMPSDQGDEVVDPALVRRQLDQAIQNLEAELKVARGDEKNAIQKQIMALRATLSSKIRLANATKERNDVRSDEIDPRNPEQGEKLDPRAVDSAVQQFRAALNAESVEVEELSKDDYEQLDEAAKRQWKRYGNKFVRKFRCYGGPKDGKMVSTAAGCGMKKDPLKVRRGKKAARMKKGQRIRKTMMTKRKAPSKRLVRMNNLLRGQKASRGQ